LKRLRLQWQQQQRLLALLRLLGVQLVQGEGLRSCSIKLR
jgi:hypothetical protein